MSVVAGQFLVYSIYMYFTTHELKEIKRPFNILMFLGTISGVFVGYGFAESVKLDHYRGTSKVEIMEIVGLAGAELMYILVSWIRSSDLMKRNNPASFRFMNVFVKISPLVFSLPGVAKLLQDYGPTVWVQKFKLLVTIATFMAAGATALCDTIFLNCFIRFLLKSKEALDTIERDFTIISEHGVFCSLCIYAGGIVFVTCILIGEASEFYNLVTSFVYISLLACMSSLLMMKVRLEYYRKPQTNSFQSAGGKKKTLKTEFA
ncbi:hypothetical protein BDR26DRAFT_934807 [Obelidium mucronatum]|nr:hypothetical protein BDR26DRAFT_934807 [Obelidium mucronatum]